MSNNKIEHKRKFPLWIHQSTLDKVCKAFNQDNCHSQSEFIEKAVEFYLSYLLYEGSLTSYAPILSSIIDASVKGCEEHLSRNHFKIAVELAKVSNLLAVINELDDDTLRKLHVKCIDEVRKTNGVIRFEDAVKYQQG